MGLGFHTELTDDDECTHTHPYTKQKQRQQPPPVEQWLEACGVDLVWAAPEDGYDAQAEEGDGCGTGGEEDPRVALGKPPVVSPWGQQVVHEAMEAGNLLPGLDELGCVGVWCTWVVYMLHGSCRLPQPVCD